jgi:hypothetical protein
MFEIFFRIANMRSYKFDLTVLTEIPYYKNDLKFVGNLVIKQNF